MEAWLLATEKVCAVLELTRVPDHSPWSRTFQKLRPSELTAMKDELLTQMDVEEAVVAGDSTRFRLCQASAYYQTRRGRQYRDWVKGADAVGVTSRLVLGWASGAGRKPDFHFLRPLKRQASTRKASVGWTSFRPFGAIVSSGDISQKNAGVKSPPNIA